MKVAFTPENEASKSIVGKRCVVYFRSSLLSDEYARQEEIDVQTKYLADQVWARDLSIIAQLSDVPLQTSMLDRPGLTLALRYLESGLADVLMIESIERFTRAAVDLAILMGYITKIEKRLIICREDIDTATAPGQLLALSMCETENGVRDSLKSLAIKGEI